MHDNNWLSNHNCENLNIHCYLHFKAQNSRIFFFFDVSKFENICVSCLFVS